MQEHFPGSVLADNISDCEIVLPPDGINHPVLVDSCPWLNQALLTLAFKQFDKHKCPGPDGLRPIVLCHLPDKAKAAIIEIYNPVIELKYTPLLWQASDIVFLINLAKMTILTNAPFDTSLSCPFFLRH
jgi:hypothetical protein